MTGFPWLSHRTLREVEETKELSERHFRAIRDRCVPQLSGKEMGRFRDLLRRAYEANPQPKTRRDPAA